MKPSQVPLPRTIDKRIREKLDEYDNILGKGLYQLPTTTTDISAGDAGTPFKPLIYTVKDTTMYLYIQDAGGTWFKFTGAKVT